MGQVSPREMLARAEQLELDKLKPTRVQSLNTSPVKMTVPSEDILFQRGIIVTPALLDNIKNDDNDSNEIPPSINSLENNIKDKESTMKQSKSSKKRKRDVQEHRKQELTTNALLAKKGRSNKIDTLIRRYRMSDSEDFKIMKSIVLRDEKTVKQLTQIKRWMVRICPFLTKLDDDILLELANTLSYRSYKFGDEVCNNDMCGIIIEGQVSARVRTRDQVFEEIMKDSQLVYNEIENVVMNGDPLLNILDINNAAEKNLVIAGLFKDIELISNTIFSLISHIQQNHPVLSLSDFKYIFRRYKVAMSHDEIESIFNVIHVDYVGEEELKRRREEEEEALKLKLQEEENKKKERKKMGRVSLFGGVGMKDVKGKKQDEGDNEKEDEDDDDEYADDDFEDEFDDSMEEADNPIPIISSDNFNKWFIVQSKQAKRLLYAILDELNEIYENFLKPPEISIKIEGKSNINNKIKKGRRRKKKETIPDRYDVTRNGFLFIYGEENFEDANETWEHFFAYCKREVSQSKFINWCMKFPEKAKAMLDGKRRYSMESEVKELYDLLQIELEVIMDGDPNDVNNKFVIFLKEIVETQLGDRYYLDDFQAWYLVESEEAIDLAYKYIKLKRIWLGQEIFTFFDSKIKGLVDAKSLQKAFHRLNINIDSQKIKNLLDEFINIKGKNKKTNQIEPDSIYTEEKHVDIMSFCKWFCEYKPLSKVLIKRAFSLLRVKSSGRLLQSKYNSNSNNQNAIAGRIQTPVIAINARTATIASSIFRSIDNSSNGYISIQDLIYTFRKIDYPVKNTLELHKVFSKIDRDGTGVIDENSFVEWFSIGSKYTSFLNVRYLINKIDNDRNPESILNIGSLVGNRWLSDVGGSNYATYKAAIDNTGVLLLSRSSYDNKLREQHRRHLHKIELQLKSDFPDLFKQWSKSRLQRLCENGILQTVQKKGTKIYNEGDVNDAVFFILNGGVSLNTNVILRSTTVIPTVDRSKTLRNVQDRVKKVHLRRLKKGSYFGETGMLVFQMPEKRRLEYEEFRSHNAITTEDNTKIFRIDDEEAIKLLESAGATRTMIQKALFFDKNKVASDYALKRKEKRFLKSSLLMEAPKYAKRRMDAKRKLDKQLAEERKRKSKKRSSKQKRRLTEQRLTISKSMPNLSSIPHLPVISPIVDLNSLKITKSKSVRHAVLLSDNMPFQNAYQQINFKKAKRWFKGEIPRTRFDPKLTWKEDGTLVVSDNYDRTPKKAFPKMVEFDDDKM